jgi:hypothetical protein
VEVTMDTRMFVHTKTRTIYVLWNNGKRAESSLWIQVVSCDDLAFFPDSLDFGKIARGDAPTRQMVVAVPGQPKLQVTAATCESKFIQVKVQELGRGTTRAVHQVSATVRADIPEGELRTEVELSTNNPAMPRLLLPLTVEVEPRK